MGNMKVALCKCLLHKVFDLLFMYDLHGKNKLNSDRGERWGANLVACCNGARGFPSGVQGIFPLVVLCFVCSSQYSRRNVRPGTIVQGLLLMQGEDEFVKMCCNTRTWHHRISAFAYLSRCVVIYRGVSSGNYTEILKNRPDRMGKGRVVRRG